MKRARWWIIGLGCLGLISCLFTTWHASTNPFDFLGDAEMDSFWIRTGFGPDTAVRTYRMDRPFNQVVESARAEVEPKGWKRYDYSGDVIFSPHGGIDRQLVESISIRNSDSPAQTRVDVARSATLQDRIGLWLWERKHDNPSAVPIQGSPAAGQP